MEPMDATARGTHETGRVTVRPVEVEKCHPRGLELPLMVFEKLVLACVATQVAAVGKRDGPGFAHTADTSHISRPTSDHDGDLAFCDVSSIRRLTLTRRSRMP
jgi:hypothetical protein